MHFDPVRPGPRESHVGWGHDYRGLMSVGLRSHPPHTWEDEDMMIDKAAAQHCMRGQIPMVDLRFDNVSRTSQWIYQLGLGSAARPS